MQNAMDLHAVLSHSYQPMQVVYAFVFIYLKMQVQW